MKIFTFYLPQYHVFDENDKWWGKGFTEWTNVTKETPRYKGHHQPQLPSDMGYYDLRVQDSRIKQTKLANEYGIDGFIYYHYWFHGKRIMNKPFDLMFDSKDKEKFPFALCWANETWTRAWDGQERNVLIEQTYSENDDIEHVKFLVDKFLDERYIKVEGKPLFSIYRIGNHPDPERFISLLRRETKINGFDDVYLCGVKSSFSKEINEKILSLDLDSFVDFQPNSEDFPSSKSLKTSIYERLKNILPDDFYQFIKVNAKANKVIDYEKYVTEKISKPLDYFDKIIPCVFPSWDNSARRTSATIIQNTKADLFEQWLRSSAEFAEKGDGIILINAWNEWAEGCHLEPDTKLGLRFLETIKKVKNA